MASTFTDRIKLEKPGVADPDWHVPINGNADKLEAINTLSALFVSKASSPSHPLGVDVAPGAFEKQDGTFGTYAGTLNYDLPDASTRYLWLDAAGALQSGAAWPSTAMIRLAVATTAGGAVTSVVDARTPYRVAGMGTAPYLLLSGGALDDGANVAVGTSTGTKIGTATGQKLGFWGATPVVQQGPFTSGYATATTTAGGYSATPATTSYSGLASGQGGSPYAQVADLNGLRSAVENLRLFVEGRAQYQNGLVAGLKAAGFIK